MMPQTGVSITPALLSFSAFFFFSPFNPWKQSQRAAAPGSASRCRQGWGSTHVRDLGFAGDSRKIPLPKPTLWLPGGFRAGQGVGRTRDVLEVQERSPPCGARGCPAKGWLFLGCKRKIVQLLKLAANPRTIINNFPAKVPGYFLSVLAWKGRFILFAAWNFFPLSFFPLFLWRYLKPTTPPSPGWGCCSPGCLWVHGGVSATSSHGGTPSRTFWDVFKAHPSQSCRAFAASR